ncbi:Bax inhibitor-1/YccA family protein [Polluticoccus soli]|uniref:Bax inhibitor-1/YccA family protein n=1 Tax=Polluticoccus soli TaxID=3034150 RepID=UPI0023E148C9|nr:Bax inhibitor-1/YccA family protein [Flavipsychrobacter sp. JY13-12]
MENYENQKPFVKATVLETSATRPIAKTFMANVFLWMFAALGVSTFFAVWFANSPAMLQMLINAEGTGLNFLGWAVMLSPIGFVLLMSLRFQRLSMPAMITLFMLFAVIMGISLSFTLLAYTASSVVGVFAASSAMFGVMAVLGYTTDKDLTSFGRLMMMGLIGILIASVVNWFMNNSTLDYIISIVGVMVFTGLTAYDVQKLKRIGEGVEYEGIDTTSARKMSVLGAMTLYLDFVNLFLMLLRLFGRRD